MSERAISQIRNMLHRRRFRTENDELIILLCNEIESLRETISNQYERHSNQIADLRKQIEKLQGVHGA